MHEAVSLSKVFYEARVETVTSDLFLLAADLPAPLSPAAGSAAAEAKLQGQQVFSSQRQVSATPLPPPRSL